MSLLPFNKKSRSEFFTDPNRGPYKTWSRAPENPTGSGIGFIKSQRSANFYKESDSG